MTVNVLVFVLCVVFFHLIVYIVTWYMYDVVRRDFALSANFVLEFFDSSEVTTREGNAVVVQEENCAVEEIKEVELRSRRGKFIYNVTVFEENAGQQCVAISLCALIYSKITKITSVDNMTQIMVVGIQLYSSVSLLARQSMLLLTELPGIITVFEQFFHLE